MTSAASTADPHQCVDESVTVVSSFHGDMDAILVCVRVNSVLHSRVFNLIKYILGTR